MCRSGISREWRPSYPGTACQYGSLDLIIISNSFDETQDQVSFSGRGIMLRLFEKIQSQVLTEWFREWLMLREDMLEERRAWSDTPIAAKLSLDAAVSSCGSEEGAQACFVWSAECHLILGAITHFLSRGAFDHSAILISSRTYLDERCVDVKFRNELNFE